ncbi:DNA repair protein RadA [bacterium]|nr:DNA repair protein RadA [bacterium]
MSKQKTVFICQSCGYETYRWMGKCPECDSWNSFAEEILHTAAKKTGNRKQIVEPPAELGQIESQPLQRVQTQISEFDRVLGGGIVPGSAVLIGGAPGMGKSTLLLQVCGQLTLQSKKVLYISGEESIQQIKLRADRLSIHAESFFLVSENNIETIIAVIDHASPDLVVLDSIQTVFSDEMESVPGNISQVRYCGHRMTAFAKQRNMPMIMVGHVTKEGNLAGPRVLEHLVDCLLLIEGDGLHQYRILRTIKNRFGSTNEVGLFEMTAKGIVEVENPSAHLLSEKRDNVSGAVVTVTLEGARPLMIEVQALVTITNYGTPQRTATGLDYRRLAMILAVLEKKAGLRFGNQDVFVNVAGGIRLQEPASDLAIAMALYSSLSEKAVPDDLSVIGEVGLTGEVRSVSQIENRIHEAARLGFKRIIVPHRGIKSIETGSRIRITGVQSLEQAIEEIF